ncbi:EF-hand domain-containing protein [Solimonas terrae]|uniref:EF-hand domain-containing protein n=1 Tax=Solimonas terrae TaxID=1396819 RepID=A0A6M2BPA4_9GAMM|nr:EF-hand domain-containing protein [Solimonas terrae]NGY03887.1 hypothetical protein [Solimonas terrae]
MKKHVVVLAVVAGMGLLAGPAFAQDTFGPGRMKAVDTDGDGAISRDEAQAALKSEFARLDRNHDGQISEDEFVGARMEMFDAADTDGDGKLTRAELRQRFLAMRKQQ